MRACMCVCVCLCACDRDNSTNAQMYNYFAQMRAWIFVYVFFFFALTSKELFALNPSKLLSNKDNIQEGACTAFLNEFKYALGTYI